MSVDPLLIFAENRGVYLNKRDAEFVRDIVDNVPTQTASQRAGYGESRVVATKYYDQFRGLIEAWKEEQKSDYYLVLNTLRHAAESAVSKKYYQDALIDTTTDSGARCKAAMDLSTVLGFNAAQKSDVTVNAGELPDSIKDKLAEVYKDVKNEIAELKD
jgi:hypothetical protein